VVAESDELFNEIAQLRDEVEDQGTILDALLRAGAGEELREKILVRMRNDRALAEIFLLVDGLRSQGEIVQKLAERGLPGASRSSVSIKLEKLANDYDLIRRSHRAAAGNVYYRTRLARILKLERALEQAAR
jgi:hypothetical protein